MASTDYLTKKMDSLQTKNNYYEKEDNDIDLKKIFNTLKRNKKLIFGSILALTLISSYRFFKATPIWSGSFNIVVKDENKPEKDNIAGLGLNTFLNLSKLNDGYETQRIILKSPSVLMPVFDFVKNNYTEKGLNTDKMFFNDWVESALKVEFEDGSSVLKVEYFDADKELIINTLKLISTKNIKVIQNKIPKKQITKSIIYLEEQKKLMKERSLRSTKELNEFSINNGLGNIDGFVGLSRSTSVSTGGKLNLDFSDSNSNNPIKLLNNYKNNESRANGNAGTRYINQFELLKQYEAKYVDLSAKLAKYKNPYRSKFED